MKLNVGSERGLSAFCQHHRVPWCDSLFTECFGWVDYLTEGSFLTSLCTCRRASQCRAEGLTQVPAGAPSFSTELETERVLASQSAVSRTLPTWISQLDLRGDWGSPRSGRPPEEKAPRKTTSPGRILGDQTLLFPLNPGKTKKQVSSESARGLTCSGTVAISANFGLLGSPSQLVWFGSSARGQAGRDEHPQGLAESRKRLERAQGLRELPSIADDRFHSFIDGIHIQPQPPVTPAPEDPHFWPPQWAPVHTWYSGTHAHTQNKVNIHSKSF